MTHNPRPSQDAAPAQIKAGDRVRYHPVIGGPDDGRDYVVAGRGQLGNGYPVAYLEGKSGCVSMRALTLGDPPAQPQAEPESAAASGVSVEEMCAAVWIARDSCDPNDYATAEDYSKQRDDLKATYDALRIIPALHAERDRLREENAQLKDTLELCEEREYEDEHNTEYGGNLRAVPALRADRDRLAWENERLRGALAMYTADKNWRLVWQIEPDEHTNKQRWVWMQTETGPWQFAADALAEPNERGREK